MSQIERFTTLIGLLVVFSAADAAIARAEVVDASNAGFAIKVAVSVGAPPPAVFQAITGRIAAWWSSSHTFSGSSSNLTLDPRPGGCFCERLPGGGVQHMVVTHVNAPGLLVLHGGLGPLGTLAVAGSLSFALSPEALSSSRLVLSYDVGGYAPKGLSSLAAAVDTVLTEQVQRLKNFLERGTP
jgi:uncharacterized protein YndB with AHSA1/START domain